MYNKITSFSLSLILLTGFTFTSSLYADYILSGDKLEQIESRVNNMSANQLQQRMIALEEERASLQSNGGSSVASRLAEISAELSMIQKA